MRAPRTVLGVAVASLLLVIAAPSLAQEGGEVDVVDSAFEPASVSVEAGATVTWTQTGNLPHSVTADDGSFDSHPDCSGGSDCMATGDTFAQTFDEPGEYPYYCRIHGGPGGVGMSGVVVVTAAGATQAPSETATPSETGTPDDASAPSGSIEVEDQSGDGTSVTVASVTITGADGFVVIHLDEDGGPGPVIGHVAIDEGTTTELVVPLDQPLEDDATVWPMLHVDAGTAGTYEFPGADVPVSVDGAVVMAPLDLTVTAGDATTTEDDELADTGTSTTAVIALASVVLVLGAVVLRRSRRRPGTA